MNSKSYYQILCEKAQWQPCTVVVEFPKFSRSTCTSDQNQVAHATQHIFLLLLVYLAKLYVVLPLLCFHWNTPTYAQTVLSLYYDILSISKKDKSTS